MANERFKTSVTPEIIKPDGGHLSGSSAGKSISSNGGQNKLPDKRRASTGSFNYGGNSRRNSMGKPITPNNGQSTLPHLIRASSGSCHDVVNLRRNSTGKPSSPNNGGSVAPNYLRISTGSCHDFCKYGGKHAFEAKARCPIAKGAITPSPDRQNAAEFGVLIERKTTAVIKLMPSPVSKTLSSEPPSTIKKEVSAPLKNEYLSSREASSNEKKIARVEKKKNMSGKCTPMKPKTMTLKTSSYPNTSRGLKNKRYSEIEIAEKPGTSKASVKKIIASSLPTKPSDNRVMSVNVKNYGNLKVMSPLKDQHRVRKTEHMQPNCKVREKTLHVIKVETEKKVLESDQNGSTIHLPLSPTLSSPKSSFLPRSPAFSFDEEEAQEESEYIDSEVDEADHSISERSETTSLHEVNTSEGNHKRIPRKGGVGIFDNKDRPPAKLKFRRGKVVDLQSENTGPRRLRFQQGKVLGENQDSKADVRKRNFKKRGDEDDTNGTNPDSEKVVLRHQDMQGKKDAQGLFNNVIEETASKLVESRKSKVKALVGAFETVISLQQ
ncbi:hypothetical protein U1Q18_012275, partial [Sarracenia purpurea var. burkii]